MTIPSDASIARAFLEMHPISSRYASAKRFADVVMAAAAEFDAESPAGTAPDTDAPLPPFTFAAMAQDMSNIAAKRTCTVPTCRAEMRPGLRCNSTHCGLKE